MNLKLFSFLFLMSLLACFVNAERPARCMEPHPRGAGPCLMLSMGYYFNPQTEKCEQWNEGGCTVEGGNTYSTLTECAAECMNV